MRCPRCHSNIAAEDDCCPDCKLPRLKGREKQEEEKETKARPQITKKIKPSKLLAFGRNREMGRQFLVKAGIPAMVVLCGLGAYIVLWPMFQTGGPDPKASLLAMSTLRQLPSNQDGLTVDDYMKQHLESSRRAGDLVGYRGWVIEPVAGTKSKLLIVFAFNEKGNKQQRAEWLADLASNTFTPQTEMAAAVYNK